MRRPCLCITIHYALSTVHCFQIMKKLLTLLPFLFWACKNPAEDFVLGFKEPIETGTLRIQFNLPEEGKVPAGLQFSVTGPDADKMVNHLNSKKFRINAEGLLVLAIDPDLTPTAQEPVDFTVVAEAEGYLKVIKNFRYTARTNRTFSAQLVRTDQQGTLNTRQLEIGGQATVEVVNGAEKLELHFPGGNRFYDEGGETVNGPHDLALITYASASALSRVPGGVNVANPQNAEGKPLGNPFAITRVAGMVSMEMSTQNHEIIKSFGEPVRAVMQLNPNTVNPETGKAIKEGDRLDILSYDTDLSVWKVEGEAQIRKNTSGGLMTEFLIPHLSYWLAAWTEELCATGPSFRFSSDYTNLDISYTARLVNARDGSLIREYNVSLNQGGRLNVSLMRAMSDPVKLVVVDYNNYHGGDKNKVLATSAEVSICESRVVELPFIKLTPPRALTLEMDNSCPNGSTIPDSKLPAQLRVQFSDVGKNTWRDAGIITRGARTAVTYRMMIGKRYDMRGSTDGGVSWPYLNKDVNVNKTNWTAELRDLGYCK